MRIISVREWIWGMVLMLLAVQLSAQGRIQFEKSTHNMGTIKEEEGLAQVIFPFTNTGKEAFKIEKVQASCGCTTPQWSKDPVMPGSQGFIKVSYNPLNRPGSFKKKILVQSTASPGSSTLTIYGRVTPRPKGPRDFYPFTDGNLRFKTNHLTYGAIFKNATKTERTVMYNQGQRPIRFNRARSIVPAHVRPFMTRGVLEPGDTMHLVITYDAAKNPDWGFAFDNMFLATDDPDKPMKRINLSADLKERFPSGRTARAALANLDMSNVTHDFGKVIEGEMPRATFALHNSGKSHLVIRKLYAACGCLTVHVTADSIPPGGDADIHVTFNSRGRIGQEEKEVTLITNDPAQSQRILRIKAQVIHKED